MGRLLHGNGWPLERQKETQTSKKKNIKNEVDGDQLDRDCLLKVSPNRRYDMRKNELW
jgi:hypothetical protein